MVAVSMGDPAGIGREVILKAAAALARRHNPPALVVVGDLEAMRTTSRELGGAVPEPSVAIVLPNLLETELREEAAAGVVILPAWHEGEQRAGLEVLHRDAVVTVMSGGCLTGCA